MDKNVIIIGAGGHGKVVADTVLSSGNNIVGFLDDDPNIGESFTGFPVLGRVNDFRNYPDCSFVIAIGNADVREKIANQLQGVSWYTAIHPTAVISKLDVCIGEGTVIMANAVVNAGSVIGKHCILNTGSIVEHDNQLDDFVHISVGARLAGTVHVGKKTWIGIGASIRNNLSVCAGCMIGAGAAVVKNIEEAGTYVGVPAERKSMKHKNISGGGYSSRRIKKKNVRPSAYVWRNRRAA